MNVLHHFDFDQIFPTQHFVVGNNVGTFYLIEYCIILRIYISHDFVGDHAFWRRLESTLFPVM